MVSDKFLGALLHIDSLDMTSSCAQLRMQRFRKKEPLFSVRKLKNALFTLTERNRKKSNLILGKPRGNDYRFSEQYCSPYSLVSWQKEPLGYNF